MRTLIASRRGRTYITGAIAALLFIGTGFMYAEADTHSPSAGSYVNYPYSYYPSYQYPYRGYSGPPSCTITLSPSPTSYPQNWVAQYGYPTLLSWYSTNATSASISPGIGSVSPTGSRIVYVRGQIYSMAVYGPGGTGICQSASYSPTYPYGYSSPYSSYGSNYNNYYSSYQPTYPAYTYPTYQAQPTVRLSQMPYTGADFGLAGNLLAWLAVMFLAAIGAVILARRMRFVEKVTRSRG